MSKLEQTCASPKHRIVLSSPFRAVPIYSKKYRKMMDNSSDDLWTITGLLDRAMKEQELGNLSAASTLYETILAIRPEHKDALRLLGAMAVETQQFTKALQLLNSAAHHTTDDASLFNNKGIALMKSGQLHEALENFDKAIELRED